MASEQAWHWRGSSSRLCLVCTVGIPAHRPVDSPCFYACDATDVKRILQLYAGDVHRLRECTLRFCVQLFFTVGGLPQPCGSPYGALAQLQATVISIVRPVSCIKCIVSCLVNRHCNFPIIPPWLNSPPLSLLSFEDNRTQNESLLVTSASLAGQGLPGLCNSLITTPVNGPSREPGIENERKEGKTVVLALWSHLAKVLRLSAAG